MARRIKVEVERSPKWELFRYAVIPEEYLPGIGVWFPLVEYLDVFMTRRGAERYAQRTAKKLMAMNSHPSGKA